MKPYPINILATWLPMRNEGMNIKRFHAGYPYLQGGVIVRSSVDKPVARYAKNYSVGGKRYSLCLISTDTDSRKMEDWMDSKSNSIKTEDIKSRLNMLGIIYDM